eukprot:5239130-Amphidinium_carterae.1
MVSTISRLPGFACLWCHLVTGNSALYLGCAAGDVANDAHTTGVQLYSKPVNWRSRYMKFSSDIDD